MGWFPEKQTYHNFRKNELKLDKLTMKKLLEELGNGAVKDKKIADYLAIMKNNSLMQVLLKDHYG